MNIRVLPEHDYNYGPINFSCTELQFLPLSWQWQTACWLCHRLTVWMISSYGDQSTTRGIILHIIIASPTLPQLLWMLPETPYVLYMQLQHQGNSEMVLLSIFFTRIRSTEGSSADCSLFILSLHALALHLAVKILLQIFLYEDLSTLAFYIHLSVVFPSRMPAGPHFVTQPILLSENIPNIWHKSSTKHKEVRPDWNDKNDNANYAPRNFMEGFTNGSGCHF